MADNKSTDTDPVAPDFGDDYDEAPDVKETDADFDAPEENAKEVKK